MSEKENKELRNLLDITIDENLPEKEKIQSFVKQIKDPYRFRIGDAAVRVSFTDSGDTITDSVISMVNSIRNIYKAEWSN